MISFVSGAVTAALAAAWYLNRPDGDTVSLVDQSGQLRDLLEQRQGSRAGAAGGASETSQTRVPTPQVRGSLDVETTRLIFAMPEHNFVHDPNTFYRYRPGLSQTQPWSQHPDGEWLLATNAVGLREDADQMPAQRDLFALVAGDSHVDGMCSNDESFVALLEQRLSAKKPGEVVEALNTGTSGYNIYNYLGVLDKYLSEQPDVFVVTIYGGNDYLGILQPHHYFQQSAPPPERSGYWEKIREAQKASSAAVGMALNQAYYFQHYPEEVDFARDAALALTEEIQSICAANDIDLVWVYIPPVYDVEEERAREMERAREILDLSDYDMSVADRLTDAMLEKAREKGQPIVDLRAEFAKESGPFYWRDGHINLTAHALIARLLEPLIARP